MGLDNFATGYQKNLDEVQSLVSDEQWDRFRFIEGDIRNLEECKQACSGIDYVLHQATLGSVPHFSCLSYYNQCGEYLRLLKHANRCS